jgi:hypothetical protein
LDSKHPTGFMAGMMWIKFQLLIERTEQKPRSFYKGFTLIVIPGLTRNPVSSIWIPAFAGMTASELM